MAKMETPKALELLKEYMCELDHLRTLRHANEERWRWKNKVDVVLEAAFGKYSYEYNKLNPKIFVSGLGGSDADEQRSYLRDLDDYEARIKEILDKYDILGIPEVPGTIEETPTTETPKALISHGKESKALNKVERFLRELGVEPLIVKDEPSLDKTVDDKVDYYLGQADFVVILATGDDEIEGKLHPRQNVIHETGLAQKTHAGKIIYLLEEKTEFPSNISPKVWEHFNQDNMENVFLRTIIELKALGMLKAVKQVATEGVDATVVRLRKIRVAAKSGDESLAELLVLLKQAFAYGVRECTIQQALSEILTGSHPGEILADLKLAGVIQSQYIDPAPGSPLASRTSIDDLPYHFYTLTELGRHVINKLSKPSGK